MSFAFTGMSNALWYINPWGEVATTSDTTSDIPNDTAMPELVESNNDCVIDMNTSTKNTSTYDLNTFRLDVSSTAPYNEDFDGDEMSLFVPQDVQTVVETQVTGMEVDVKQPIKYDLDMGVQHFLGRLFPNEPLDNTIQLIRNITETSNNIFIFQGTGGNGKTVFERFLMELVGEDNYERGPSKAIAVDMEYLKLKKLIFVSEFEQIGDIWKYAENWYIFSQKKEVRRYNGEQPLNTSNIIMSQNHKLQKNEMDLINARPNMRLVRFISHFVDKPNGYLEFARDQLISTKLTGYANHFQKWLYCKKVNNGEIPINT